MQQTQKPTADDVRALAEAGHEAETEPKCQRSARLIDWLRSNGTKQVYRYDRRRGVALRVILLAWGFFNVRPNLDARRTRLNERLLACRTNVCIGSVRVRVRVRVHA